MKPQHSDVGFGQMAIIFGIALALLAGCGKSSDLEYVVVSGNVTWQGKPVPNGMIRFIPIGATKGPVSAAEIVDGHYEASSRGGVPVGEHRVEITAQHGGGAVQEEAGPADIGKTKSFQYLPARFNRNSGLKANVGSGEDAMTLDYELK